MIKTSFKKNRYVTIFGIMFIFITLAFLGIWQLKRLEYKENLVDRINLNYRLPAAELAELNLKNYNDLIYRKVKIKGRFLNDKEIHLFAQHPDGGAIGYDIIAPIIINDQIFLVDRGWVPNDKKEFIDRQDEDDYSEFTALIMPLKQPKFVKPYNDRQKNIWIWLDIDLLKDIFGNDISPILLQNLDDDKNKAFIKQNVVINIYNQHAKYAIMWLSLSVIWILYCYYYYRKNVKR